MSQLLGCWFMIAMPWCFGFASDMNRGWEVTDGGCFRTGGMTWPLWWDCKWQWSLGPVSWAGPCCLRAAEARGGGNWRLNFWHWGPSDMCSGDRIRGASCICSLPYNRWAMCKNTSVDWKDTYWRVRNTWCSVAGYKAKTKSTVLPLQGSICFNTTRSSGEHRAYLTCSVWVEQFKGEVSWHPQNISVKALLFQSGYLKTMAEASGSCVPQRRLTCLIKTILSLLF